MLLPYPFLEQSVLPLQLSILGKHSHAYIQFTDGEMVGTFNITDNIIQIAAEKNLFIDNIAAAKIIGNAYDQKRRYNEARLQIAHQHRQQHNQQQIQISINLGVHIMVKSIEHTVHLLFS